MEDKKIEERLEGEYKLLNSPKYKEFTTQFMAELGNELEAMFPGVTFVMYLRYKSDKSVHEKIKRISARTDEEDKNIYDYIGLRIVVTHISDKVEHKNCQDILKEKDRLYNEREEEKAYRDNLILKIRKLLYNRAMSLIKQIESISPEYSKNYEFMVKTANDAQGKEGVFKLKEIIKILEDYIERNPSIDENPDIEKNPDKEQIKALKKEIERMKTEAYIQALGGMLETLEEINKNIQLESNSYNEQDRKCNDLYSQYMIEQIKKKSKALRKFGILEIPGRYRKHTGSKHYYVAMHDCFKTSKRSEYPDWKFEMQVTSDYHNQEAEQGKARHSEKEGKARVLPSTQEIPARIADTVPETYLYICGTKSDKGKVVKCPEFISFYLYYREVIPGREYLKGLTKLLRTDVDDTERE